LFDPERCPRIRSCFGWLKRNSFNRSSWAAMTGAGVCGKGTNWVRRASGKESYSFKAILRALPVGTPPLGTRARPQPMAGGHRGQHMDRRAIRLPTSFLSSLPRAVCGSSYGGSVDTVAVPIGPSQ
jgi:hypothetical protein